MYRLVVHRRAARYLRRLPQPQRTRIKDTLRALRRSPFGLRDVRAMAGEWAGYHRIRIGDLRIIFWMDEVKQVIYVDHIGPRGDVYR